MKIKQGMGQTYRDWYDKNNDGYGRACFTFAERWAEALESLIASKEAGTGVDLIIRENAETTSHEADTEGITGFMYGMAISILAHTWEYGEELRRWHNLAAQIGDEGEKANENGTVLNPALISITK